MLLNEAFLFDLTPEEKSRYEALFVIRKEVKESMKEFRKEYNMLKSHVKKLEKKYGKSSEYIHLGHKNGQQEFTKNAVLGTILQIENKYLHIEYALRLSKDKQKHFTKLLQTFPFDIMKYRGTTSYKLSALQTCISSAKDKISEASNHVSIANKSLNKILQYLQSKHKRSG